MRSQAVAALLLLASVCINVDARAIKQTTSSEAAELPEFFDFRVAWFGCGLTVLDQGRCGSCWAVSATGVAGDRFCVHKAEFDRTILGPDHGGRFGSGALNREFMQAGNCAGPADSLRNHGCRRKTYFLSPQALVSCASMSANSTLYPQDEGCNGGNSFEALRFLHLTGLPTMGSDQLSGCVPYTAGSCPTPGGDPHGNGCRTCLGLLDECADSGEQPVLYRAKSYGTINQPPLGPREDPSVDRPVTPEVRQRELNIMREIYLNGPVLACIFDYDFYTDFYNKYPLGVFNNTEGSVATGGHCLNLIGWGIDRDSGMKYWLMRNSWGGAWASNGVARIKRGVDFLGIENDVWAMCPEGADSCELTDAVDQSPMDLEVSSDSRATAGLGIGRGGYWLEQQPDSAPVQRALAAYIAETAAGGAASAAGAAAAAAADPALLGVKVLRAFTQVGNGLTVKLQLSVPEGSVAAVPAAAGGSGGAVALSLRERAAAVAAAVAAPGGALSKLLTIVSSRDGSVAAAANANDVVNHGCDTGKACNGRSQSVVNGMSFCCQAGCNSCSISANSNNGHTVAVCVCSSQLEVSLVEDWATGSHSVIGHATELQAAASGDAYGGDAAVGDDIGDLATVAEE